MPKRLLIHITVLSRNKENVYLIAAPLSVSCREERFGKLIAQFM